MKRIWRVACFVGRLLLIGRALWRGKKDAAHDEVEAAWARRWRRTVGKADV